MNSMIRYILTRILFLFITLFIVFTMLFVVARFAELERMEVLNFTEIPLMEKTKIVFNDYVTYVKNIASDWDWGTDARGRDGWSELQRRMDLTLRLNIFAFFFYTGFGVILGVLGALYKGSLFDRILNLVFLVFSSIPAYVMIMILILYFGYNLGWFPPQEPPPSRGLFIGLKGMVIPVLAISSYALVQVAQLIRGEMTDAFNSDYIQLLKTKGLNQRQIVLRHLIKHSMVPVMTSIVPIMLYVLGSSFIVERVYNIQGLSNWLLTSLMGSSGNVYYVSVTLPPMVLVGTFLTGLVLLVGLIVDIVYGLLDPRITMGGKKSKMD
ncbi:MAG: ABC transporter permease [Bacillota bacterium]